MAVWKKQDELANWVQYIMCMLLCCSVLYTDFFKEVDNCSGLWIRTSLVPRLSEEGEPGTQFVHASER